MKDTHKITNCNACLNCLIKCPSGALLIDEQNELIVVDRYKCINCYLCMETCPVSAIDFVEGELSQKRHNAFKCDINKKRITKFQSFISALKISLDSKDTPRSE